MDDPVLHGGPDKRVPPKVKSEGHACRARRNKMDNPTLRSGRDERVPPREIGLRKDRRVLRISASSETEARLSKLRRIACRPTKC